MINFYKFLESWMFDEKIDRKIKIGNKEYVFRATGRDVHLLFPYARLHYGKIYELSWFPIENLDREEKYERTKNNSLSEVREILRSLPNLLKQFVNEKKPVGYYWKANDGKLADLWERMKSQLTVPGYVSSRMNPEIFVQEKLKPSLDVIDV